MPRHALRAFLRRVVLVGALPLGGCPFIPPGGNCGSDYDLSGIASPGDGGNSDAGCAIACEAVANSQGHSGVVHACKLSDSDGGAAATEKAVSCSVHSYCIGGRRPAGLETPAPSEGSEVGRYFAAMAHLEAASVGAFQRLATELGTLGAPDHLIAAARRSASDERRHARIIGALATRFGATVPAVRVNEIGPRSPLAIAVENAVSGCVEETWAAIVATWQGQHAADPKIRAALARIAEDEARHAELAWDIADWLAPRLDRAERAEVQAARQAAVAALLTQLDGDFASDVVEIAGLPCPAEARSLAAAASSALWS